MSRLSELLLVEAVRDYSSTLGDQEAGWLKDLADPHGIDGTLEARASDRIAERSWNYITLGYGHGETWWRRFCTALKLAGCDDVLSIEHEDMMMSPIEGMRKSVELLRKAAVNVAAAFRSV
jgi:sugar phosphate isomerase/epimerase